MVADHEGRRDEVTARSHEWACIGRVLGRLLCPRWSGTTATVASGTALFALYVAGYSAFRIVEELLRVDPATHLLGLHWNLLLAIAGTGIGLGWFPPHS